MVEVGGQAGGLFRWRAVRLSSRYPGKQNWQFMLSRENIVYVSELIMLISIHNCSSFHTNMYITYLFVISEITARNLELRLESTRRLEVGLDSCDSLGLDAASAGPVSALADSVDASRQTFVLPL